MKRHFRESFVTRAPLLVLIAEPPTQPPAGVHIDRAVGFADCSQTKVVGPAVQHSIELLYECLRSLPDGIPSGLGANGATDSLYPFLGWDRAEIDSVSPHRVTAPERVPQEVELFFRQMTDPRFPFVHRQLQLRHHLPHRSQGWLRPTTTADDEVIGIVHDVRFPTLLVP